MPECAVCVPVRTSTWANTIPRVASVSAGVSASTIPLSKTITASAPRASARTQSPTSSEPLSSAPSISTRTLTGRSPAGGERARDVQEREEVALVVGRAAGVDAAVADRRLERRRVPQLEIAGVLHVVVAVDHHRLRVLARGAQVADDEWRAAGSRHQIGGAAGAAHALHGPRGGVLQRFVVARAGRDRRDPQPVERFVEKAHLITASVSPAVTDAPSEIGSSAILPAL